MRVTIVAASNRQPAWAEEAFDEYAKRYSGALQLEYKQVKLSRHSDVTRRLSDEGRKLLAAVPRGSSIVALDERGEPWSTRDLAGRLERWMAHDGRPCFIIGGPDGLAPDVTQAAERCFCLSALTLPHALARILVAESVYRAFSLLSGHPYHRE